MAKKLLTDLNKIVLWILFLMNNLTNCQELTQNSNYFITKTKENKVFISSFDGLNIFDGLLVKHYKPSNHNMYGNNIQSYFYEDKLGNVWFTTYEAINIYFPKTDELNYIFIVNSEKDTIRNDYKLFWQSGDSILIAADKNVYLFDLSTRRKLREIPINLKESVNQLCINNGNEIQIVATKINSLEVYKLSLNFEFISIKSFDIDAFSITKLSKNQVIIGTQSGSILTFNIITGEILFKLDVYKSPLLGIARLDSNNYMLSSSIEDLLVYNIKKNKIVDSWTIKDKYNSKNYTRYTFPYIDKDSILWIGVDGRGIVNKDLKLIKFNHLLQVNNNQEPNRVTGISENTFLKSYAITTRGNGIYILDEDKHIIQKIHKLPYVFSPYWLNFEEIIFTESGRICSLNYKTSKISILNQLANKESIINFERIDSEHYIISSRTNKLYEYNYKTNKLKVILKKEDASSPFLGVKFDGAKSIFVSMNEQKVWLYQKIDSSYSNLKQFNIPGGIISLTSLCNENKYWYITNVLGVYKIDKVNYHVEKVIDNEGRLNQTIYSLIEDNSDFWWLSSNLGIIKYNPKTNTSYQFKLSDGLQAMEFNANAFLKTSNNEIWLGGVNGINVFNPDNVKLLKTKATVCIDDIQVDDRTTNEFGISNFAERIKIKFGHPISIFFHAVDYGDIESARLKYKLIGVDNDLVEINDFKGNVRYPNLTKGHYKFQVIAANSDGIWNETPRNIEIEILPPYWQTWWFRLLVLFSIIIIAYKIIQAYYRRQLEKKDFKLREQSLIIDKQEAVEKERTRIASEMHDDLGSGLTTIRYLSDRALKNAINEAEKSQIKKIADQSNALVHNMSEIIWAMNGRFDTLDNLISYIRRYASEYLEEYGVQLVWKEEGIADHVKLSGEKRRNVFLVVKEALHNIIKYADANKVEIHTLGTSNQVQLIVRDNGRGFDIDKVKSKGNGLFNMQKRMQIIGGSCEVKMHHPGTEISLSFETSDPKDIK